jgi:hypothetical protein
VLDGTPKVRNLQVSSSTFHKIAAGAGEGSLTTSPVPGVGG